jgi:hypothetical protein
VVSAGTPLDRVDLVLELLVPIRIAVAAGAAEVHEHLGDFLLQPYPVTIDSAPVLSRLVNMQFVRRDAGRSYLHQLDRDYALSRIAEGEPAGREASEPRLLAIGSGTAAPSISSRPAHPGRLGSSERLGPAAG